MWCRTTGKKDFSSETTILNYLLLGTNYLWEILHRNSSSCMDHVKKNHGCHAILVSDWLKFEKSSPLKVQMICNLVQMMYMRLSTKMHNFVLIWQKTWPSWAIFIFDWQKLNKIFSSGCTLWRNVCHMHSNLFTIYF